MEIILILATILGGIAAIWFFYDRAVGWLKKNNDPELIFHLINDRIDSAGISPASANVRFSLTNPSDKFRKIERLKLRVLKTKRTSKVYLPEPHGHLEDVQMVADIKVAQEVELTKDMKSQFMFDPEETIAFDVRCFGAQGTEYEMEIECNYLDIKTGKNGVVRSPNFYINYVIFDVDSYDES